MAAAAAAAPKGIAMRHLATLLATICVMGVACSSALAGNPNSSSITLKVITAGAAGPAQTNAVSFGSNVTFNVSTKATIFPWVEVLCFNGSTLLLGQTQGFFNGSEPIYALGPTQAWPGGPASCTATLFSDDGGKVKDLASTSFNVTS
jgi:hypothetical protein